MTRAEEKAYHRGKLAAFNDARETQRSERARCEFRSVGHRRKWQEGYAAQLAEAAAAARTPEQDAAVASCVAGIQDWLARQKGTR